MSTAAPSGSVAVPQNVMSPSESKSSPAELAKPTSHIPEHPDAVEIRRQVEYYFSDENLANDDYFRDLCKAQKNVPVPLEEILSFKRMRKYQPKEQVVEALHKCKTVEIVDNAIRRRVAYSQDIDDPSEIASIQTIKVEPGTVTDHNDMLINGVFETRGEGIPCGFQIIRGTLHRLDGKKKSTANDEVLKQQPVTVEDIDIDKDVYNLSIPLHERINIGIYRFTERRKFDAAGRLIFEAFLKFSDIHAAPVVNKLTKQEMKDMNFDPYQKAMFSSPFDVPDNLDDSTLYEIDFLGVAESYLGDTSRFCSGPKDESDRICKVLASFHDYFLNRKVCPEFADNIEAAKNLSENIAPKQLHMLKVCQNYLPGHFNEAINELVKPVDDEGPDDWTTTNRSSRDANEAQIIALTALLAMSNDKIAKLISNHGIKWTEHVTQGPSHEQGFEVVSVEPMNLADKKLYYATRNDAAQLVPVGKLVCKSWHRETYTEMDVPENWKAPTIDTPTVDFWLEESALICLTEGIKFEAEVRKLTLAEGEGGSIWVINQVKDLFCSFYKPCLNELAPHKKIRRVRWREPIKGRLVTEELLKEMEWPVKMNMQSVVQIVDTAPVISKGNAAPSDRLDMNDIQGDKGTGSNWNLTEQGGGEPEMYVFGMQDDWGLETDGGLDSDINEELEDLEELADLGELEELID